MIPPLAINTSNGIKNLMLVIVVDNSNKVAATAVNRKLKMNDFLADKFLERKIAA